MVISRDVHILTTAELDRIKDEAFRRGVERGRIEQSFDDGKRVARNCTNWLDGHCEKCGVQWQNMQVSAEHKCQYFHPKDTQ